MRNKTGRKLNNITGIVAIVAVLFVMLVSSYFLASSSRHICCTHQRTVAGCPVCVQIERCQSILKKISVKVFAFIAFLNVVIAVKMAITFSEISLNSNLVTQKVRIDR